MKRPIAWFGMCAIVATTFVLARGELAVEPGEQNANGYQAPEQLKVALVDVESIFKGYDRFKTKITKLKAKADDAEKKLKDDQRHAQTRFEEKMAASQVPPSKESMIKELTELKDSLDKEKAAQLKLLMREEGSVYHDTIAEINRQVARSAKRHGIHLVLRIDKEPVDPTDRNDVLRGIKKVIMYSDPQLDITEEVLAALNSDTTK